MKFLFAQATNMFLRVYPLEVRLRGYKTFHAQLNRLGVQWVSGRVLDSRPKGSGFEPHCIVVLEQDTFSLA